MLFSYKLDAMRFFLILFFFQGVYCHKNVSYDYNLQPLIKAMSADWVQHLPIKGLLQITELVIDLLVPTPLLPKVDEHVWWGDPHHKEHQDTSIRPFSIQFNGERIHKLLEKLQHRENFTQPLQNAQFNYGTNTIFLQNVLDYWLQSYNFKERESRFNQYPQYKTNVQGLDIHYYHIKPHVLQKKKVPLLMLHGWPATNTEYLYLFPELLSEREGCDYVFEIIAPTIPGFGYSEGTSKIGLNTYQIAIIIKNLMNRLGHQKFYIHAGDFGQAIAADMMTLYQNDVLGLHTNFPYSNRPKTLIKYVIGSLHPPAVVKAKYAERMYPILRVVYYVMRNFGYFHEHATKPDTLGVALKDSPSGLASWILTAMSWSSNPNFDGYFDGGLPETFDINDVLDILTIMWDSESITTSMRIYAEFSAVFQDPKQYAIMINPTKAAYACIKFRHEIIYQPDSFIKDKYLNLVHSKTLDYGGHFAALENPKDLAEDIWVGVQKMIEFNAEQKSLGSFG